MYSQLLAQATDLGLGIGQLHGEVLPALSASQAGGVPRGWPGTGHQGGQLHAVPFLGQIHDGLGGEGTSGKVSRLGRQGSSGS